MGRDLSEWKVKQLKDHLHKLGLPVSGNKQHLIQVTKYSYIHICL